LKLISSGREMKNELESAISLHMMIMIIKLQFVSPKGSGVPVPHLCAHT